MHDLHRHPIRRLVAVLASFWFVFLKGTVFTARSVVVLFMVFSSVGFLFSLHTVNAAASDIYIAQSATGTVNGADCNDAYAVSFFNTSSNWASTSTSGKISPGVTVHLCGIITSVLTAQGSGSSGSPITILFEAGAKLSSPAWPSTGAFVVNGKNYITIDGGTNGIIENTANGGNLTNQVDSLGVLITGCKGCIVHGLTIQNIYVQGSAAGTLGTCLEVLDSSSIHIHHNTESTCGYTGEAYSFTAATTFSSVEFDHETYSNNCAAFKATDSGNNSHLTGFSWHDNDVTLPGNTYAPETACHVNGIHIFMVNAASSFTDGGLFYNNYIHGDIGGHSTAYMFFENTVATANVNPNVFNNLFVNTNNADAPSNGFV